MIKKVEVLANLAVIITSVVVCTVLVRRYFLPSAKATAVVARASADAAPRPASITPGTHVSLPGVDWSKSDRTVLLALSTTCHFCSESAPFYQKLQQEKRHDVRLVALFPQPLSESHAYLEELGISVTDVLQGPLSAVGVAGTPTLLLVDNQGIVINSWVGKLSDTAAQEVWSQVIK